MGRSRSTSPSRTRLVGVGVGIGIGIDLVSVARVRAALERYPERFRNRVFTPAEVRFCETLGDKYPSYAGRFAAKEAFSKALGTASTNTTTVSAFQPARRRNYGPLSYDLTHVASLRYTWTLPKPGKRYRLKTLGLVADGWELAGISVLIPRRAMISAWQ